MKNIVLIGMPGSGKSTVGVLLAKTLCKPFVDTDLLLQQRENRFLQDIINTEGTDAFLMKEQSTVLSLTCTGTIIATGGSVVCKEASMQHLKENGVVLYLKLSPDNIEKRIKNIKTRGIAAKKGETIDDIYRQRSPLYEKYCDYSVDCNDKEMEEVLETIVTLFKNHSVNGFLN